MLFCYQSSHRVICFLFCLPEDALVACGVHDCIKVSPRENGKPWGEAMVASFRMPAKAVEQALAMANSSMTNRLSRLLAASLAKKAGTDEAFIRAAFQQVLGRDASADEAAASAGFLKRVGELAESQAKNPAPEKPAKPTPLTDSRQQPREYLILALFNHTDFLTIR